MGRDKCLDSRNSVNFEGGINLHNLFTTFARGTEQTTNK